MLSDTSKTVPNFIFSLQHCPRSRPSTTTHFQRHRLSGMVNHSRTGFSLNLGYIQRFKESGEIRISLICHTRSLSKVCKFPIQHRRCNIFLLTVEIFMRDMDNDIICRLSISREAGIDLKLIAFSAP